MLTRLAIIFLVLYVPLTKAHQIEYCLSSDSDIDGDGWGWENGLSCKVIEPSDPPEYINQETGQPVVLQKAYWSKDDFASDIVCNEFYFDGTEYRVFAQEKLFRFEPLSSVAPHTGELWISAPSYYDDDLTTKLIWSLENGAFIGPTSLGFTRWVEVIPMEYTTPPVTVEAVRVWTSDRSYSRCRVVNPRLSLTPTGTPPVDSACIDSDGDGWGWNGSASCLP